MEVYAPYFGKKLKRIMGLFNRRPFSVSNFYDGSIQRYVNRCLKERRIDSIICFCSSMAEYVFQNPKYRMDQLEGVDLLMDYVDLDSDKWLQYARYSKLPKSMMYWLEHRRLFKYEVKINRAFHHSLFVSNREEKVFRRLYPQAKNIHVVPNGVDQTYFTPKQQTILENETKPPTLIFTGFMDYFANEDGVRWFCQKIFPKIKARIPDVQFYIVGNRPTNFVWTLSEMDGVTVTGYVEDIREFYWKANVCVIPLRIARGMQNKVIEAMATGNAVVATTNASDGIICRNGQDIIIADDEERFVSEVVALLENPNKIKELGRNAIKNVQLNYNWETNLKLIDRIVCNGGQCSCP